MQTLFRQQSLAFGKVVFLTTYGLILAFFFLPASSFSSVRGNDDGNILATSLAVTFVVSESEMKNLRRKRRKAIRKLRALSQLTDSKADIFCVDLAVEMSDLANQAYNDGGGLVTLSGYASLDLESLGYELVDQIYDSAHEAVCYIARHKTARRMVVIFR